ncbi:MAG: hypothetical protein Q8Q28_07190 [Pseudomonadota bacterium]|nr:hypothetical protein [Pseudomonadota bacterium]
MSGPVRERLDDAEHAFEDDLRGLVTTGMASDVLADLLAAPTIHEDWQVGEALAECLLEDIEGAVWPWNTERDKRTPKASLPGADMIGFVRLDEQVYLLLGETKSSSEANSPPNVMTGRTGISSNSTGSPRKPKSIVPCSPGCTPAARARTIGPCTRRRRAITWKAEARRSSSTAC